MNKLGIAGTAGGLLTLIVEIVSLATTNWIELGQIHLGLFQACASGGPCVSINSVGEYAIYNWKNSLLL